MSGVTLHRLTKRYGEQQVIHGIDLHIRAGEFCVFVGPSGCGKSTLLRMIAGLEQTTTGNVHIGTADVTNTDPADRGIAMVFQTYALYPHMTVAANMGFGLKMNGVAKAEVAAKIAEVADILQIRDLLHRKPSALSGGQRQRVAIGRALVRDPRVFLFDEPLSNLDAELRVDMRVEIARLHRETGATMIYVTHDQVEAMTLADTIVVLRAGRVEQSGPPMELYSNPTNAFVAGFIGSPSMNFISSGTLPDHRLPLPDGSQQPVIGIRPEHLALDRQSETLKVEMVERLGGVTYVHAFADNGERLIIEHKQHGDLPRVGDRTGVTFAPENLYLFDPVTEVRIKPAG